MRYLVVLFAAFVFTPAVLLFCGLMVLFGIMVWGKVLANASVLLQGVCP